MRGCFILVVVAALLACRAAPVRQGAITGSRRLGILGAGFNAEVSLAAGAPRREALRIALRDLGHREDENLAFVERLHDGPHSAAQIMDKLAKARGNWSRKGLI